MVDAGASLSCDIVVTGHSLDDVVVGRVEERTIPLVVDVVVDSLKISPEDVIVGDSVVCAASNVVVDVDASLVNCVAGNSFAISVVDCRSVVDVVNVVDSLEISEKDVVVGSVDKCSSVKVVVVETESVVVC